MLSWIYVVGSVKNKKYTITTVRNTTISIVAFWLTFPWQTTILLSHLPNAAVLRKTQMEQRYQNFSIINKTRGIPAVSHYSPNKTWRLKESMRAKIKQSYILHSYRGYEITLETVQGKRNCCCCTALHPLCRLMIMDSERNCDSTSTVNSISLEQARGIIRFKVNRRLNCLWNCKHQNMDFPGLCFFLVCYHPPAQDVFCMSCPYWGNINHWQSIQWLTGHPM